jgi:endonuclease/exonuclease/phosphatase (EEP) superfamily protein YafD
LVAIINLPKDFPMKMKLFAVAAVIAESCFAVPVVRADEAPKLPPIATSLDKAPGTVRVMTYNVENWRNSFQAFKLQQQIKDNPNWPPEFVDLIERERREDDEENWEVARVIQQLQPDIWLLQEGPEQGDLNYFNTQPWLLNGYFETIHVFPSNSNRGQTIAILARPGLKVVEYREDYHKEPDTAGVNTEKTGLLFARGPAFALIETADGARFWVGTNHQKSKSGNSVDVTKWRNAEATRTHQIIQELRKTGPAQVIFTGDLNDEAGYQEFEQEAGGSAIDLLVGAGPDALVLATKPLDDAGKISYHGQSRGRNRSFIDHAIVTPEMSAWVKQVGVGQGDIETVASDHFPVLIDVVPEKK